MRCWTNRLDKELAKLADHNKPGLGAVPARVHNTVPVVGKTVGTSTCPKAPSDKALSKAMSKVAETAKKPATVIKATPAQVAVSGTQAGLLGDSEKVSWVQVLGRTGAPVNGMMLPGKLAGEAATRA